MKKLITTLLLPLLLFSACCKEKEECGLVPAKLIRFDCDRAIFQLLTDQVIGDPAWTDVNSGRQYNNVVSCFNTCEIAAITNGQFMTLYVNLEKTDQVLPVADCVQCQAVANDPPDTNVIFKTISGQPCGNTPD